MSKVKKSVLSVEVYKYPYYGRLDDTEDYLSNKICWGTIKIRKKFIKTVKLLMFYGELVFRLRYNLPPSQAIGIPVLPPIIRMSSNQLNGPLSKNEIITRVSKEMSSKIVFTKTEMDQLYDLSVKYKDNAISQEELLTEISNLRGGSDVEVAAFLVIVVTITFLMASNSGFPINPNGIIPPHLRWMYGNQYGYGKGGGPRSVTVVDATRNAGSEKNDPSFGSYDYDIIMDNLACQVKKKRVNISAGDQSYTLENPFNLDAHSLKDILSEKMYDSIRDSNTDISEIAKNLGYKPENLKKIKDHVFYNKHKLDKYVDLGYPVEYERFDPDLNQALAWKRLQSGIHNEYDITWLKHELLERRYEVKYDSGYSVDHGLRGGISKIIRI